MIEHRLIERAIEILGIEKKRLEAGGELDPLFIDKIVDFIKTYADRTHHGKEEDILFESLEEKPLSGEEDRLMQELIEEHKLGRRLTGELVAAKDAVVGGNREELSTVLEVMGELIDFYPQHIKKEDDTFFPNTERHYSNEELDKMLREFYDFDMQMIHEKYQDTVAGMEGR
jgi:hemerythrin-like domain-containing protein